MQAGSRMNNVPIFPYKRLNMHEAVQVYSKISMQSKLNQAQEMEEQALE
jgi:hypothetical protein